MDWRHGEAGAGLQSQFTLLCKQDWRHEPTAPLSPLTLTHENKWRGRTGQRVIRFRDQIF